MKEVFQIIGVILAIIISILGYIYSILRYKSSNRDKWAELGLFKGLTASSAISIYILLIFIGISLLF